MKRLVAILIIASIGVFIWYTLQGSESQEEYLQKLVQERAEKDEHMKGDADSPFANNPDAFTGLKYYPPDLHYKIKAQLLPIENKKIITLPTSDGKQRTYLEYGRAVFKWDTTTCRLLILEVMDPGRNNGILFLGFADVTSALETYGAGRYLELKKIKGATSVELDFNNAYNPYCAYSKKYSCPFPPRENVLKIAIKAGEKTYSDDPH